MAVTRRVSAVLVTAGMAGNQAASYLLNIAAARLLAPAAFGELGSLLAVLVVGAVPAMGLQTVAALRTARHHDPRGEITRGLTTSALVTAVALAAAPLLTALLHLHSVWPAVLVATSLTSITFTGLCYGILQGGHRFAALAAMLCVEAVCRMGGTLAGLAITRDATGALAGTTTGALVVAVTAWVVLGRPRPANRAGIREVLHAAQAMLALVLLVNLDLVLARHHLPPGQAGEYAVGAIITKIAYWLPQAVAVLVLPRLADETARRRLVPRALAVCAAMDAVVVLGAVTAGDTVKAVVGGAAYTGSAFPVWPFAVVGSMLSLVQILLYSRIAGADRRSTLLLWAAVALEIVLVTWWLHDGLLEVVTAAAVTTGSLVAAGALVEFRTRRLEPGDAQRDHARRGEQ